MEDDWLLVDYWISDFETLKVCPLDWHLFRITELAQALNPKLNGNFLVVLVPKWLLYSHYQDWGVYCLLKHVWILQNIRFWGWSLSLITQLKYACALLFSSNYWGAVYVLLDCAFPKSCRHLPWAYSVNREESSKQLLNPLEVSHTGCSKAKVWGWFS